MSTLRDSSDPEEATQYLGIQTHLVRAALSYYADFAAEVDDDAAVALHMEIDERSRWDRQRQVLGTGSGHLA